MKYKPCPCRLSKSACERQGDACQCSPEDHVWISMLFFGYGSSILAQLHLPGLENLSSDAVLYSVKDVIHRSHRGKSRFGTFFKNARTNENRVPSILGVGRVIELVRAPDIGFWRVANEVNRLWWLIDAMHIFPPLLKL